MAKRKNTTAAPTGALTPFNPIIILCIEYALHIKAESICYKVDPDPDNGAGAAMADEHIACARAVLEQLADMPARTAEELSAKARLVEYVIERMAGFGVEKDDVELRYLARLADDVRTFVTPTVDANWKARKAVA